MADPAPTGVRRRGAATVVLVGVAASGAAAYASGQAWFALDQPPASVGGADFLAVWEGSAGQEPAATALALVALAAWGVLLVTRGVVRRLVALVGLAATVAGLAVAVSAAWRVPDRLAAVAAPLGVDVGSHRTAWYAAALSAFLVGGAAFGVAFVRVRGWGEMGRKYDAPSAAPSTGAGSSTDSLDLWKALDEGRDPTDGAS